MNSSKNKPFIDLSSIMYQFGKDVLDSVQNDMVGRVALSPEDAGALACVLETASVPDMTYVEIGSLFGGSAILAGLCMNKLEKGYRIICIDPMDGYYGEGEVDPVTRIVPTAPVFRKNMIHWGLQDSVSLIEKKSISGDLDKEMYFIDGDRIDVMFIDGDHSYDGLWNDLELSIYHLPFPRYIVIHDYRPNADGVVRAAREFMSLRADYRPVLIVGTMLVLESLE